MADIASEQLADFVGIRIHDEEALYRGYFHMAANMQAQARRLGKLSATRGLQPTLGIALSWMVARADCRPAAGIRRTRARLA